MAGGEEEEVKMAFIAMYLDVRSSSPRLIGNIVCAQRRSGCSCLLVTCVWRAGGGKRLARNNNIASRLASAATWQAVMALWNLWRKENLGWRGVSAANRRRAALNGGSQPRRKCGSASWRQCWRNQPGVNSDSSGSSMSAAYLGREEYRAALAVAALLS